MPQQAGEWNKKKQKLQLPKSSEIPHKEVSQLFLGRLIPAWWFPLLTVTFVSLHSSLNKTGKIKTTKCIYSSFLKVNYCSFKSLDIYNLDNA